MVTDLHLEGGDLIAFALVHQFAQSDAGIYKGNTSYLSAWTGWSERTSRTHLISLQNRGLITEERGRESNSPYCYYKLGPAFYDLHKSTPQKLQGDTEKNTYSTPQKPPVAPCKKCGEKTHRDITTEFTPPTPQEVADYVRSRGWTDPDGFAAYYIDYQNLARWRKNNGKKIEDWKLNVLSWEPNNKTKTFSNPKVPAFPSELMHQMTEEEYRAMLKH